MKLMTRLATAFEHTRFSHLRQVSKARNEDGSALSFSESVLSETDLRADSMARIGFSRAIRSSSKTSRLMMSKVLVVMTFT